MAEPPKPDLEKLLASPSYRKARDDPDFLAREDLRGLRLQLEYLKVEKLLDEQGVHSMIVVFGGTQILPHDAALARMERANAAMASGAAKSAREASIAGRVLAKSRYYDQARELGRIVSSACQNDGLCDYMIVTGGGPGIMEAANRGAYEAGAKSAGFNITLPDEQLPNPYITPELCFQFHYFAVRKMHFLLRAKALVCFPGGLGTLDELLDALTLRQTNKMQNIPILLFGKDYWDKVVDFQFLADEGAIRDEHQKLFEYVDSPTEAWERIQAFHA